jgi:hypothetical protein
MTRVPRTGNAALCFASVAGPCLRGEAEGRRECVVALEVRSCLAVPPFPQHTSVLISWLRRGVLSWGMVAGGGAGLPAVEGPAGGRPAGERRGGGGGGGGEEGEERKALVDFAVHGLKGDLFPDLMEYMG